jgi:ligand-binding SRPBCC domain-containing protein
MRQHFRTEQSLPYARELVFAFFANPMNLPRLMPKWQRARIEEVTLVPPKRPAGALPGIAAGRGTRILLSARPFPGSPLRGGWEALIDDFHWNESFCDLQVKGPFVSWRHCHSLHERTDGQPGIVVRDDVEYEPPAALFSSPIAKMALAQVFRYRQQRTAELMPTFAATATSRY